MVTFAGVDLAWTGRYPSGICILQQENGTTTCSRLEAVLTSPEALAAEVAASGENVVAAVDAPLILHDDRRVERLLVSEFGRYKIGAHQANRTLLEDTGRMAGPRLAEVLAANGFSLDPEPLISRKPGRYAVEVYPHAAHVRLFALDERIPYKAKQGRRVADRLDALTRYRDLLVALLADRLPDVATSPAVMRWLAAPPHHLRGAAIKGYEDVLDALTCAVVAHHAWEYGREGLDIIGDLETGFVAVPRPAA